MSSMNYDGRYAPSPTGSLHLGNLRTALAAWLFARGNQARFYLRIDDIDPDRSRAHFVNEQLHDLQSLGIDWDGDPVVQTERFALYEAALSSLAKRELTYPCFCTRADIRAAASAAHGASPDGAYPGTCSSLTSAEAQARIDAGEEYALRVRAHSESEQVHDHIQGSLEIQVDDFVVRRKDGVPAYLLATTVDDSEMAIGTVLRGADLLDSAPRQIWLAKALGILYPDFAHVGLVVGSDKVRLAKRHGAITMRELEAEGRSSAQILRMLARSLGLISTQNPPSTAKELLEVYAGHDFPRDSLVLESL